MTAKNGFKNELDIADRFNNWKTDREAKIWLELMQYNLEDIEFVRAEVIRGHKADINVQITIKLTKLIDIENLQVKLVSNKKGFNQIDKRWLKSYTEMWSIDEKVLALLRHYTGELPPYKPSRDSRRMFLDEFSEEERQSIISFFEKNRMLIVQDILRGRGRFSADWVLVAQRLPSNARWVLRPISEVISHYFADGSVIVTRDGNLRIGRIGIQRKGGDGGKPTANMLQFKIDPVELFDV
ncbi:MAG: type II restriction endonuclease [Firmicutes bacterium]|nr:type II restriction endonuclease [Bacillota bacterium]